MQQRKHDWAEQHRCFWLWGRYKISSCPLDGFFSPEFRWTLHVSISILTMQAVLVAIEVNLLKYSLRLHVYLASTIQQYCFMICLRHTRSA